MCRLRTVQRIAAAITLAIAMLSAGCGTVRDADIVKPTESTPDADAPSTVQAAESNDRYPTPSPIPVPTEVTPSPPPTATPTPIPVPTATPAPSPTPTALPIERRTLLFSGDVLSHVPVIDKARAYGVESGWAYDYRPMYDDLRARIGAADLAICVLETPVSPDNTGLAGYPLFNAPSELPAALVDAGYDACSTASNHSLDRGPSGVAATLDAMDAAGLGHAGMARNEAEWAEPTIYEAGGLRVAHLSWSYGLNGLIKPDGMDWLANVTDLDAIAAEAERARAAGADVVVLSIQWGNEYQRTPSSDQEWLADRLGALDTIDLIVGNHVHVVQPITAVGGVPVIYGLGNSLSNQYDRLGRSGTQDGLMVEIEVTGNTAVGWAIAGLDAITIVPTWVDRSTYRIVDVAQKLAEADTADVDAESTGRLEPWYRAELEASLARTLEAVELLGETFRLAGAPQPPANAG